MAEKYFKRRVPGSGDAEETRDPELFNRNGTPRKNNKDGTPRQRRVMSNATLQKMLYKKSKAGRKREAIGAQLKQSLFMTVEYYMRGMTKQQAMVKAGYSESYASQRAYLVFGREDVQRAIEQRRYAMKTRQNGIVDRIQDELAKIAFFNIGQVISVTDDGEFIYDFSTATMDEFAAIGECTVEYYTEGKGDDAKEVKRIKVKPYDKKAALDSLARINGMFNDNASANNTDGMSIEERLQKGRERVRLNSPKTIDGEFEVLEKE